MFDIDQLIKNTTNDNKVGILKGIKSDLEYHRDNLDVDITKDENVLDILNKKANTVKEYAHHSAQFNDEGKQKSINEELDTINELINTLSPIKEKDKVNHPSHYTWLKEKCGIEVIDITRHMDFDLGNAIKYILRCGHKSEEGYNDREKAIEDLRKAVWYINDEIKTLETNG